MLVSLVILFIVSAVGQTTTPYVATQAGCLGGNNPANQGGFCYRLRYPLGQVPAGDWNGGFAVGSGLLTSGNSKWPYAWALGARWASNNVNQDSLGSFGFAGAGAVWVYRAFGVVCDRDGTPGFQDPSGSAVGATLCSSTPSGTGDCVLGYVLNDQLDYQPVNITDRGTYFSVRISDTPGLYRQECYVKKTTGAAADPTVSGVTLGEWNTKCDIELRRLSSRTWTVDGWNTTANIWTTFNSTNLQNRGITCNTPMVGIQVYLGAREGVGAVGASPTISSVSTSVSRIALGTLQNLTWQKTATCVYADSTTATADVVADARVITAASAEWSVATQNGVASGSQGAVRINFSFRCPVSNAGSPLERINWDPELSANVRSAPLSASAMVASLTVLMAVLALCLMML